MRILSMEERPVAIKTRPRIDNCDCYTHTVSSRGFDLSSVRQINSHPRALVRMDTDAVLTLMKYTQMFLY